MDRYDLALADSVKRILEEETGDLYVLDTQDQLRHEDNDLWGITLDDSIECGYIVGAHLADGRLSFTSDLAFHADFFIQNAYSEVNYFRTLHKLGPDFEWLHLPEIRKKHSRSLPHVMRYLNQLDRQMFRVNKRFGTNLTLGSGIGMVYVRFEILLHEMEDHDRLVRRHLRALKDMFQGMTDWLDENGGRYRKIYGEQFAKI